MIYRLASLPALLRTPVGRAKVREGCYCQAWPLLSGLARAYRLRLARQTRVVAVVGSFGKTTTARTVAAALGRPADPRVSKNFSSYVAEAVLHFASERRSGKSTGNILNVDGGVPAAYSR